MCLGPQIFGETGLRVLGALLPKTGVGGHVGFRAQRLVFYIF